MPRYEYKVIPAPRRGEKARGVKTTEDRFALALTGVMNALGAEGWEYLRADTLPVDERTGLTGTKTTFQNLLVFRREVAETAAVAPSTLLVAVPQPVASVPRLGPAEGSVGPAPAVGPAKSELAAE
jgi:hypothetical protein